MELQHRINAFHKLSEVLRRLGTSATEEDSELLALCKASNGWFNEENVQFACLHWSQLLSQDALETWAGNYDLEQVDPKTVAIIMAGNVPLVGFHDFLAVLLSGHKALVKLSSNDPHLLPYLAKELMAIEPGFEDRISFAEEQLANFDAVIATGSNNTARYFDHYFGKYPGIIRKNRNSVAVLNGSESEEELTALADDIFRYYGLGCRNVSKLYVPKGYNFDSFFQAAYGWRRVINDHKYINNYDYNKAVYLMSNISLLDNEFLLLKEDEGYSSPISVVFYEYYEDLSSLRKDLNNAVEDIQCVVSDGSMEGSVPFGTTQTPGLSVYADGVDTLQMLQQL
ncbi:MAG: acyl-CoA reductase [Bacteroidota bacterium]